MGLSPCLRAYSALQVSKKTPRALFFAYLEVGSCGGIRDFYVQRSRRLLKNVNLPVMPTSPTLVLTVADNVLDACRRTSVL